MFSNLLPNDRLQEHRAATQTEPVAQGTLTLVQRSRQRKGRHWELTLPKAAEILNFEIFLEYDTQSLCQQ